MIKRVQFAKKNLLRHKRLSHQPASHVCQSKFARSDNLRRHLTIHARKRRHSEEENNEPAIKRMKQDALVVPCSSKSAEKETGQCNWCLQEKVLIAGKKYCYTCSEQGRECRSCHRPLPERLFSKKTETCDSCTNRRERFIARQQQGGGRVRALEGTAETETMEPNPGNLWDVLQFFVDNKPSIENTLIDRLSSVKGLKWFMTLFVRFLKYNQNDEAVYAEPSFRSVSFTCMNFSQIKQQLAEAFQHLHNAYQNFEREGSGWSIDKILRLELNTAEYTPLEGSRYLPLPPKI